MGFMGHAFRAQEIAQKIGWQSGPFQFEVAAANLAFGVLGIMCIWQRRGFRTATGIGYAIFLLGCGYGHFRDMTLHGNFSPYNVGAVLWVNDLGIPVVLAAARQREGIDELLQNIRTPKTRYLTSDTVLYFMSYTRAGDAQKIPMYLPSHGGTDCTQLS